MAIPRIISRNDFAPYVEVATNLVDNKLFPRILEAQNFSLCELMGDAFYYDFIGYFDEDIIPSSEMPAPYLILYNGGSYTHNNNTYQIDGLKPVVVYFSAARLLRSLDMHITPNGVMQKRNEFSDHIDTKAIGAKATEYDNLAIAYWNKCKAFVIASGKTDFPKWPDFCKCDDSSSQFRNRVYGIQGENLNTMGKGGRWYGRR